LAAVFPAWQSSLLPPVGRPSALGGRLSFEAVRVSAKMAVKGAVDAVVTAPISKTAWGLAGVPFADHTDYFQTLSGARTVEMILGLPEQKIWCVLATRHIELSKVEARLSAPSIFAAAESLRDALIRVGISKPRLCLCALNPHAGEGGRIGQAEKIVLAPAARRARSRGLSLAGPMPADSAWRLHREGIFDGLVCLYHDQALIPLKVLGGLSGINWTVGIPFVRTSPAHGTAFDRARGGSVDASGTIAAAVLAARLCGR
jgi:4-hydroxythreonine-4-phosphate dehydrogenase